MSPAEKLMLLASVGTLAGFLNVMAGGGSLLTLPVMVFMGLEGPQANGSNRIAILCQNIVAVFGFFRKGFADFKLSLTLALCALPGAIAGAYGGTLLRGAWFNRVLALVMIGVMILMVLKKKSSGGNTGDFHRDRVDGHRLVLAHVLMFGAGLYGGFIQAGVGFILMAILHRVLGLDLVRVNMHKVFIVGVYTVAAAGVFAWQGKILWQYGLALALGNALGGWIGAHVAVVKGEKWIRIVFFTALTAMAIKLLWP